MILKSIAQLYTRRNSFKSQDFLFNSLIENVDVSVIVPVFNQEALIVRNVLSIINNLDLNAEIHIINDNSEDSSDRIIREFLSNYNNPPKNLMKISYYSFKKSQFETYSDHFAITRSSGRYIIEVQADMFIKQPGFDRTMIAILENNHDIFMLSGRGIMPFSEILSAFALTRGNEASVNSSLVKSILKRFGRKIKASGEKVMHPSVENEPHRINPNRIQYLNGKKAGRLGRLIEDSSIFDKSILYVGETVMRGPICFLKERYNTLGGFNISAFFLGFDEHDLNLRARLTQSWRAAYTHITFESPLEAGAMRKERSIRSRIDLVLAHKRTQPNLKNTQIYISAFSGERVSFDDHEIREIN